MSADIVVIAPDGTALTDSLIISEGTDTEHRAVLQLIRNNLADFEEFGGVAFEMRPFDTAGGIQNQAVAILNEEHATLLLTYMRNSPKVKDFKKLLVHAFYAMRRRLAAPVPALQGPELIAAALIESQKVIEARESRIHQLETKIADDAPKVGYIDQYVTDADCLLFSTVASTNNVRESWLRDLLIQKDWIYSQSDSRWSEKENKKVTRNRYSEKSDKKRYFRRVPVHDAPRFRGSEVMHTLKITPAGAEAIFRLVAKEAAA
jgi:phage regulator Rha-like protein